MAEYWSLTFSAYIPCPTFTIILLHKYSTKSILKFFFSKFSDVYYHVGYVYHINVSVTQSRCKSHCCILPGDLTCKNHADRILGNFDSPSPSLYTWFLHTSPPTIIRDCTRPALRIQFSLFNCER